MPHDDPLPTPLHATWRPPPLPTPCQKITPPYSMPHEPLPTSCHMTNPSLFHATWWPSTLTACHMMTLHPHCMPHDDPPPSLHATWWPRVPPSHMISPTPILQHYKYHTRILTSHLWNYCSNYSIIPQCNIMCWLSDTRAPRLIRLIWILPRPRLISQPHPDLLLRL